MIKLIMSITTLVALSSCTHSPISSLRLNNSNGEMLKREEHEMRVEETGNIEERQKVHVKMIERRMRNNHIQATSHPRKGNRG